MEDHQVIVLREGGREGGSNKGSEGRGRKSCSEGQGRERTCNGTLLGRVMVLRNEGREREKEEEERGREGRGGGREGGLTFSSCTKVSTRSSSCHSVVTMIGFPPPKRVFSCTYDNTY